MSKKKTLTKQKRSLKGTYAQPYNPGEDLSANDLKEGIMDAVSIGDLDSLQGAISIILKKYDTKEINQETGFSKQTLQKMCLPYPPPKYEDIDKILKFLTFKIQ